MANETQKVALYFGCAIPAIEIGVEKQARTVLPKLGIDLVEIPHQACCGTPFRSINTLTWLTMASYNLALAEQMELPLLTLCNGCTLTFNEVNHYFKQRPEKLAEINEILGEQGLHYSGNAEIIPILTLLHDHIGLETITSHVKTPLKDLKIATHYGCHVIRPSRVTDYDDPEAPQKLEAVLEAIGAQTEEYQEALDCCGLPVLGTYPEVAINLSYQKIKALKDQGFDALTTICGLCQTMYATKQPIILREMKDQESQIPVKNILALVGLAMGLTEDDLGEEFNRTPPLRA